MARKTTRKKTHALLSDVTPNRGSVVMVGSEEACRDAWSNEDQRVARIACKSVPKVGERVWVADGGQTVTARQ